MNFPVVSLTRQAAAAAAVTVVSSCISWWSAPCETTVWLVVIHSRLDYDMPTACPTACPMDQSVTIWQQIRVYNAAFNTLSTVLPNSPTLTVGPQTDRQDLRRSAVTGKPYESCIELSTTETTWALFWIARGQSVVSRSTRAAPMSVADYVTTWQWQKTTVTKVSIERRLRIRKKLHLSIITIITIACLVE